MFYHCDANSRASCGCHPKYGGHSLSTVIKVAGLRIIHLSNHFSALKDKNLRSIEDFRILQFGFAALTEVANAAARIVLFGRTAGNINNLRPSIIYNKQLQIMGTVMGTPKEFTEIISLYQKYKLHPVIDKEFSLDDINEAFKYMDEGGQFGKVVLKIK